MAAALSNKIYFSHKMAC